jgi:hypothetical protein
MKIFYRFPDINMWELDKEKSELGVQLNVSIRNNEFFNNVGDWCKDVLGYLPKAEVKTNRDHLRDVIQNGVVFDFNDDGEASLFQLKFGKGN